ncbi:protein kinase [Candidatus Obscuribacterales bacterium]|nr:protein kinase [Candidatus Obscuribacterales bacterium]
MTSDSEEIKNCPKCHMPLEKKGSGSLTQWIKVCHCNRPESDKTLASPINICAHCGKRSEIGRAGTLTQWIFRADICACDKPSWIASPDQAARDVALQDEGEQEDASEQLTEIAVDKSSFPIERYQPLRRIGMGASGTVYLCRDRLLKKKVAVKVLNNLTSEQLIAFQREAKATSQFEHPNIAKVFDFGVSDGNFPYMVIEFVDGHSLDELLVQRGSIDIEEALPIFVQLCDALNYAHERNLFHRDVKPTNIIVGGTSTGELRPWLIDFGVGVLRQEADQQDNSAAGSPAYMSPDQVNGRAFDERSEIYSFGCVMFEVLTGRLPFEAPTALEILSMHAHTPPPALSEFLDSNEFSEAIEDVIATCLEKSPADRFQNFADLKQALIEVGNLETKPFFNSQIEETPEVLGTTATASSYGGKHLAIAAIVILLVCTAAGALIFRGEQKNSETVDTATKPRAYEEPKLGDAIDTLESDTWYEGLDGTGNIGWTSGPNLKDEDFKQLLKEKDLSHINVSLTDFVTGTGFDSLRGRGVKEISIKSTGLTDEGLKVISELKTLEVLRICIESKITAAGMRELTTLPVLQGLNLNVMTVPDGSIESISKLTKLSLLSLYNARNIKVSDIARLVPLQQLSFLDLTGTRLNNSVIPYVVKFRNLAHLRLGNLDLTDENLDMLVTLPKLNTLWLAQNPRITDAGLAKLSKCQKLRFVVLTGCPGISKIARLRFKKEHPGVRLQSDSDAGSEVMESLEPLERGD